MHRTWFAIVSAACLLVPIAASAQVEIRKGDSEVTVQIDGKPYTTFFYGPGVTKPYLYPILDPAGTPVTRGWPMDPHPGDRHDHIHHRGIWFAHSNVSGIDFWNSDPSYKNPKMGHIEVRSIDAVHSGPREGSITAQLAWLAPDNHEMIHENRVMTFHDGSPRMIDLDITLTAKEQVVFGDDKDGVFGMRLAPELEEPLKDSPPAPARSGVMTASNGCRQEAECWGKRADWLDVSGRLAEGEAGVTVFDHPDNPRHSTYWHARGYGLLGANIFGVKAFTSDPQADGAMTLDAGSKLRFRYRIVIHEGDAKSIDPAALYKAWVTR